MKEDVVAANLANLRQSINELKECIEKQNTTISKSEQSVKLWYLLFSLFYTASFYIASFFSLNARFKIPSPMKHSIMINTEIALPYP